jgi:hypothetical protein
LKLTHGQTRSNRFDRAREFSVVIH